VAEQKHRTLEDQYWRWHVVREARVPSTYKVKPCKSHPDGIVHVSTYIVKAVLLDFSQWPLNNRINAGLGRVAHSTELPLREVQKAVKVLTEHGWMTREKQARMGATKVTKLNWEKIEKARESYRETFATKQPDGAGEPDSVKHPEVVAMLQALNHVGPRISSEDADWLSNTLVDEFGVTCAVRHINSIPEKTLALASNPDTKHPANYLLACIRRDYREWVEGELWPDAVRKVKDGIPGVWFDDTWHDAELARLRQECIRLADTEYVIGDFSRNQPAWVETEEGETTFNCWLPIMRKSAISEFQTSGRIN
jgi:hypothetical protein